MADEPPQAVAHGAFRGHVDFFGFHEGAGGLVLGGWASETLAEAIRGGNLVAMFEGGRVEARALATFYPRPPLGDLGVGMLLVMPAEARPDGAFVSLATGGGRALLPTENTHEYEVGALLRLVATLLPGAAPPLPDAVLRALAVPAADARGEIDVLGHAEAASGWLSSGWVAWPTPPDAPVAVAWRFESGRRSETGLIAFHPRDDLDGSGVGYVALLPDAPDDLGALVDLTITTAAGRAVLRPSRATRMLEDGDLMASMRGSVERAKPEPVRLRLSALLSRLPYRGVDTLGDLTDRVLLEIDTAIHCPPRGLALIGWILAAPGVVRRIRLCNARHASVLDLARSVRLPRQDVLEAVGHDHGFDDVRCGFIVFAADGHAAGPSWLEIETEQGEIGYRTLPPPKLHGMAAIRALLAGCDIQFADVAPAYDDVLGPAITLLNAARLRERPTIDTVQYGTPPEAPTCSVIVPLHGRIDFMEVQAALFARDPEAGGCEFIYVLDDPPRRREAENLAASVYARFRLPLTLIVLGRNLGFGPASNIGLAAARGRHVCFLNSDVFPLSDGWLGALAARLDADPSLGMVGPLLLHDDGTVQHQGIVFHREPRCAGWHFGRHVRLAHLPPTATGLHASPAITGACLMMQTAVARRLGGFDESYPIGDFEDMDLCLRARAAGFGAAVDFGVRLCHLGHRSQVSSAERWRMNLTMFNAWVHERRWSEVVARALEASATEIAS